MIRSEKQGSFSDEMPRSKSTQSTENKLKSRIRQARRGTGFASRQLAGLAKSRAKSIDASEFKARCLAIVDEVARTGVPVAISKRGCIVAEVVRPQWSEAGRYPQEALRGTGKTIGDIIEPAVDPDTWEAIRKASRR